MKTTKSRSSQVAIVQPSMILGGRLQVVLYLTKCLNHLGLVPDILSFRRRFDPDQIQHRYGIDVKARFLPAFKRALLPDELNTAIFNAYLRRFQKRYGLLVNTSNSVIFLPSNSNILTYMFFPRKARIFADVVDLHDPEMKQIKAWSSYRFYNSIVRQIYRLSKPKADHCLVCMTEFTKRAFLKVYPDVNSNIHVIPPPVELVNFLSTERNRQPALASVGRFNAQKGQLQQIKLASELPWLTFHIIGFVANHSYFDMCKEYVEKHRVSNVVLHPQASYESMTSLLKTCRYFLHSTVNEPFGLTPVQAIAAGCIPLVHDSGGQRETVNVDRLRYKNLYEIVEIIEGLENESSATIESMIRDLQEHIRAYDQQQFIERMTPLIAERLGI